MHGEEITYLSSNAPCNVRIYLMHLESNFGKSSCISHHLIILKYLINFFITF